METEIIKDHGDIKVCSCGNPLIWTYMVAYAEWFCFECKNSLPMMNADRASKTVELVKKLRSDERIFRKAYKDYMPPTAYRTGCDKCRKEYHRDHMSENDLKKSEIAKKMIFN